MERAKVIFKIELELVQEKPNEWWMRTLIDRTYMIYGKNKKNDSTKKVYDTICIRGRGIVSLGECYSFDEAVALIKKNLPGKVTDQSTS